MRLINADKLLEDLKADEEASKMPLMWHNGIMYAEEHINTAPTVDAVPVIRCKECKYCDVKNSADIYAVCKKHGHKFKPFGDDTRECFCSWAERKEE